MRGVSAHTESIFPRYSPKRGGGVKYRCVECSGGLPEKNATMAIWLGKQYLGQRDEPEETVDVEDTDAYLKEAGIE